MIKQNHCSKVAVDKVFIDMITFHVSESKQHNLFCVTIKTVAEDWKDLKN